MEYNKPVAIIFFLFFFCWHQGDGHLKPEVRTCRKNKTVTKGACEIDPFISSHRQLYCLYLFLTFQRKAVLWNKLCF